LSIIATPYIIHTFIATMMTSYFTFFLSSLALVSTTTALAPQQQQQQQLRRQFLNQALSTAALVTTAAATGLPEAASATVALTGMASPFTGEYDDPNHPGCLRRVKVVGAPIKGDGTRSPYPVIEVKGYDGEGRPNTFKDLWSIQGKVLSKNEAVIDFSPKGGPANLLAKISDDGTGIVFPDGNKWTKVVDGTPERLPKDMSTIKSEF